MVPNIASGPVLARVRATRGSISAADNRLVEFSALESNRYLKIRARYTLAGDRLALALAAMASLFLAFM